ncbi:hypothetical protein [Tuwongella immobilis]|uniref:hypothetical protein n=1 Tax=Tuwongella immobilis TaxID=692036 RepID=UPI0013A6A76B|nr:hypothetical protein [Tuwongella immobilis]
MNALLRKDAEVRALYESLMEDSQRLRSLPSYAAPPSMESSILSQIRNAMPVGSRVSPRHHSTKRSRIPIGLSLSLAASVFLLIGFGSFILFSNERAITEPTLAYVHSQSPEIDSREGVIQPSPVNTKMEELASDRRSEDRVPSDRSTGPAPKPTNPRTPSNSGIPSSQNDDRLLASPDHSRDSLGFVVPKLPPLIAFESLASPSAQNQLESLFRSETKVRLELTVEDPNAFLESLGKVTRSQKYQFIQDALLVQRIQSKQPTLPNGLSDQLTPSQWIQLLSTVSATTKMRGKLIATPMLTRDIRDLSRLTGLPESQLIHGSVAKHGSDPAVPDLAQLTAQSLAKSFENRSSSLGSEKPTASKESQLPGIFLFSANPVRAIPETSVELRRFLVIPRTKSSDQRLVWLVLRKLDS